MRTNRSMPSAAVIPVLAAPDVAASARWLCDAFGFAVRVRIGGHRVQLDAGTGSVVIAEGALPGAGDSVMVRVEDADGHAARAAGAGAEIVAPPADQPYGERQYTARDPDGRLWTFSQTIADVAPEDWGGASG